MASPRKQIKFKTLEEFQQKLEALPTVTIGQTCQLVKRGKTVMCRGKCRAGFECVAKITSDGIQCQCVPAI